MNSSLLPITEASVADPSYVQTNGVITPFRTELKDAVGAQETTWWPGSHNAKTIHATTLIVIAVNSFGSRCSYLGAGPTLQLQVVCLR